MFFVNIALNIIFMAAEHELKNYINSSLLPRKVDSASTPVCGKCVIAVCLSSLPLLYCNYRHTFSV